MSERTIVFDVRVPAALARGGLVLGLLCLLASATVSEDMILGTGYSSPSGVYAGLTVSGRELSGTESGVWFWRAGGTRVAVRDDDASAALAVVGSATVGANAAAPTINGVKPALHAAGPASGLMLASRSSTGLWDLYPYGSGLGVRVSAASPWSTGLPVITFDVNTGMMLQACQVVAYNAASGTSTLCPPHHYAVSAARPGASASDLQFRNRMPTTGLMLCCRIMGL